MIVDSVHKFILTFEVYLNTPIVYAKTWWRGSILSLASADALPTGQNMKLSFCESIQYPIQPSTHFPHIEHFYKPSSAVCFRILCCISFTLYIVQWTVVRIPREIILTEKSQTPTYVSRRVKEGPAGYKYNGSSQDERNAMAFFPFLGQNILFPFQDQVEGDSCM